MEIADILRSRIALGDYPENGLIPSEAVLGQEFCVNRATIKSAVNMLISEGILECKSAVGSFVRKMPDTKMLIGYICPDLRDPFHSEMVQEIQTQLLNRGAGLTVSAGGYSSETYEKAFHSLCRSGVRGVLISTFSRIDFSSIYRGDVPVVFTAGVPDMNCADKVSIDNTTGMRLIAEHLAETGVRTTAYANTSGFQDDVRITAFAAACKEFDIELSARNVVISKKNGKDGGEECMKTLLGRTLPDAVVCYNDWTAIGAEYAALSAGMKIPADIKLTGFDNILVGRHVPVPITTINYEMSRISEKALEILFRKISHGQGSDETCLFSGRLVVRASTAGENFRSEKELCMREMSGQVS